MKVLLIGATGVLGQPAAAGLAAQDHEVTALARNQLRADVIRKSGIQPVTGNLFDPGSLSTAMTGCDAVINLATRIPQGPRFASPAAWRANDRVRLAGSAALLDTARRSDTVRTLITEGICAVYADGGDRLLDEDAPLDARGFLRSSVVAQDTILHFADSGRTAVGLRFGLLADEYLSGVLHASARRHMPVLPGPREGWRTLIRPADAGAAAVAALRAPTGIYNVGADPVQVGELIEVVAEAAGVRRARLVPPWLVPPYSPLAPMTRSLRVSSARLTAAAGWRPGSPRVTPEWFR